MWQWLVSKDSEDLHRVLPPAPGRPYTPQDHESETSGPRWRQNMSSSVNILSDMNVAQSSLHGAFKMSSPGHGQPALDPGEDMRRQVQEFNRSVTIVVWYKATTEPLRLQQMVSTFPYFQLSHFTSLVTDLGLSLASYLDTYNIQTGHWEQHTITTVRIVTSQQRLLYRIRRSLLDGLLEDECIGLREELRAQNKQNRPRELSPTPEAEPRTLKRSVPLDSPGRHVSKLHVSNGRYLANANISEGTLSLSATTIATPTPTSEPDPFTASPPATEEPPPPSAVPSREPSAQDGTHPIPYHPHPPLKRWPNDYTVAEISSGFYAMEALIAQAPSGSTTTQRSAFERVFGSRYVKSTVCRHRGVWKRAPRDLRQQFETLESDERGCWGEFVRRVEGRVSSKVTVKQPATAIYAAQISVPGEIHSKVAATEEPVMDSLQNPADLGASSTTVAHLG